MVGRVLELAGHNLAIHKSRGFLSVRQDGAEIGTAELDDLDAVLVSGQGLTWSSSALAHLAGQNVPVTILGPNFAPVAVVLPLCGHGEQAYRMADQAAAPKPLRKQIWSRLVRQKIVAQVAVLDRLNMPCERLRRLSGAVRSGDPENCEAQAAQVYWPLLLGRSFRRDPTRDGANALLNYGYAVLRAAAARAIVSAGLHPSLSVHHRSGGDALALADDLMEPFRPTVDLAVHGLLASGTDRVAGGRAALVETLSAAYRSEFGNSPLTQVLLRLAQSLSASFAAGKTSLVFPHDPIPDEVPTDD